MEKEQLNVKLPAETIRKLKEYCKKDYIHKDFINKIVNLAILEYIEKR